jgi:hypothetical protein
MFPASVEKSSVLELYIPSTLQAKGARTLADIWEAQHQRR